MYEMNAKGTSTIRKSDGLRKAAILLVALGEEAASEILRNMKPKEVEAVTQEISSLRNVPSEKIKAITNEFYKMWQTKELNAEGGRDYAEQLLQKAMGDKKAEKILQKLGFVDKELATGFELLESVNDDQLVNFFQKEHPQTVAFILSRLDSKKSAVVLEKLPEKLQVDVTHRIAVLGEVSPDFIQGIDNYLETHFKGDFGENIIESEGQKIVANILNMVSKSTEKNVLSGLSEIDQSIATEIKNLMFVFDDLVMVDDRSIQKILKEVDSKNLSIALKGANDETKQKIFKNMSQRAAGMLKEEIEFLGPVRLKEVEEAQRSILSIVSELEERGEIVIYREGSENEIVA